MNPKAEDLPFPLRMKKDKYGRRYNRPVYQFALFLIVATLIAILVMRFMAG